MDNILKAKIIVALMDELKYPILSSFGSKELQKLNNVPLDVLNNVSSADLSGVMTEFLAKIQQRKEAPIDEFEDDFEPVAVVKAAPKKVSKKSEEKAKAASFSEKINGQPPQLIACILERLDDTQRKTILSTLTADKKNLVESIKVEKTPISEQVIQVIMNELALSNTG